MNLKSNENKNIKVVPGPCMGRCDVAPTVCVGKNYVDKASTQSVMETIINKDYKIPLKFKEFKYLIQNLRRVINFFKLSTFVIIIY